MFAALDAGEIEHVAVDFDQVFRTGGSMKIVDVLGEDPDLRLLRFEFRNDFVGGVGRDRAAGASRGSPRRSG